jgi:hypothetical protein
MVAVQNVKDSVRIYIKDVEGVEMTEIVTIEEDADAVRSSPAFAYFREERDLSKLKLRYADAEQENP